MTQSNQGDPIASVREGMTVRDADGADIGTVALATMGGSGFDAGEGQGPNATADTSTPQPVPVAVPGIPAVGFGVGGLGAAGGAGGMDTPYAAAPFGVLATGTPDAPEPDVPEESRDRLIRTGYLKIDSKGLFRRDLYVSTDQVEHIEGDTVTLNTTKDHLIKED